MAESKVLRWLKWTAVILTVAARTFWRSGFTMFSAVPLSRFGKPSYRVSWMSRESIRQIGKGTLRRKPGLRRRTSKVSQKLTPDQRVPVNRYFEGSPVYRPHFSRTSIDVVLEPDVARRGVVVLLHGLTNSPYSQRHIAQVYRDRGFLALVIRMPGHGTVPAGSPR